MHASLAAAAHQAITRAVALRNQGSTFERDLSVALAARSSPVPMTFFGRGWSEAVLFRLGSASEQGTRHRRAPLATPPVP